MRKHPPGARGSTGRGRGGRFFRRCGLLALAAVGLPLSVAAQDAGAEAAPAAEAAGVEDAGGGIAVIDLKRAVEGVADFRRAAEQWTAEMQRLTAEIQAKRGELEQIQQRLGAQQDALNEVTRSGLIRQAEDLQLELGRMEQGVQEDLNGLRQQLLLPITEKVDRALTAYAEEHGLILVLDISNPRLGMTLIEDVINITDAVIERVDGNSAAP